MPQRIFLLDAEQRLLALSAADFPTEDDLQRLIAENPELLDGDLIDPEAPRRWVLIRREMQVTNDESGGRWSLDHLMLDQDGIPTLVEVKRASDSRTRREVVAQMLDKAANAVQFWPVDSIRTTFEARCQQQGHEPQAHLTDRLGPEVDVERFWQQVKTNLIAGRIRLLFLADRIPPELRRIIEFLNKQMDPAEVLGVEIRQFTNERVRTLVPHVVGQTSESEQRKGTGGVSSNPQWTEETFLHRMRELNSPEIARAAVEMLAWAKEKATRVWFGRGKQTGSFVPILNHNGVDHQVFAVYTGSVPGTATCEVYFQWYAYKAPFDNETKRREMLANLNAIDGISLPPDAISRRPSIPLKVLAHGDRLRRFLEVMEWYFSEVKTTA